MPLIWRYARALRRCRARAMRALLSAERQRWRSAARALRCAGVFNHRNARAGAPLQVAADMRGE